MGHNINGVEINERALAEFKKKNNSEFAPKFTPTIAIKPPSSPFINKTNTGTTVKFECTGVTQKGKI